MKLYCICRKPAGYNRFMIKCISCKKWFHGSCVGVSKRNKEELSKQDWYCPDCKKKDKCNSNQNAESVDLQIVIEELRLQRAQLSNLVTVVNTLQDKRSETEELVKLMAEKEGEILSLKDKVKEMQVLLENTSNQNEECLEEKNREISSFTVKIREMQNEEYVETIKLKDAAAQNLQIEIGERNKKIKSLRAQLQSMFQNTSYKNCDKSIVIENKVAAFPSNKLKRKALSQPCNKSTVVVKKVDAPSKLNRNKAASQPSPIMDKYDYADAHDFK